MEYFELRGRDYSRVFALHQNNSDQVERYELASSAVSHSFSE